MGYLGGQIQLNLEEYSEYVRVSLEDLSGFESKIENISDIVSILLSIKDKSKTETI